MERTIRMVMPGRPQLILRKRVAAYTRVSCGKDAMLHSLSAQVSYFPSMVRSRFRQARYRLSRSSVSCVMGSLPPASGRGGA